MNGYIFPVEGGGKITSLFGPRDISSLPAGASAYHEGIDISAPKGQNVLAALKGTVKYTGSDRAKGYYIILEHENGTQTEYGHLSSIGVKPGEKVRAGDIIGGVGNSGVSSGAHLDFRIKKNGQYIDPQSVTFNGYATSFLNKTLGDYRTIDKTNTFEIIKSNWLLIAGGIILIAIFTK